MLSSFATTSGLELKTVTPAPMVGIGSATCEGGGIAALVFRSTTRVREFNRNGEQNNVERAK